jgi:metallo-beta-lactamase class B
MTRILLGLVLATALTAAPLAASAGEAGNCPVERITAGLEQLSATGKMPDDVRALINDPAIQRIAPFRAFDNVYFVGICWVSSWLIVDPAGDILIDTLHEPHVDTLLANIAAVGAKPADIRYVLITHGHFDHAGGAAHLKKVLPNARFVMTRKGWQEARENAAAGSPAPWTMLAPEIVAKDGDRFTVGKTVVTAYETPGHTFGTASYAYRVRDGGKSYRAVTVGGLGLNAIKNVAQVEAYVHSVKRLQGMANDKKNPVTVSLTTHPPAAGMFVQADRLAARTPGEIDPFVDPAGLKAQLAELLKRGEARLAVEREKAKAASAK